MRRTLAWAAVLASASIIGCESQPTSQAPVNRTAVGVPAPIAILNQLHGDDPGLTQPTVALVNSQAELAALGSTTLMAQGIDFNRHSLVVLALGERNSGGYWAMIEGVQLAGNTLYVQGVANRPGIGEMVSMAITHPYAAAVIPKTRANLVCSEVRSIEGQPHPSGPQTAEPAASEAPAAPVPAADSETATSPAPEPAAAEPAEETQTPAEPADEAVDEADMVK